MNQTRNALNPLDISIKALVRVIHIRHTIRIMEELGSYFVNQEYIYKNGGHVIYDFDIMFSHRNTYHREIQDKNNRRTTMASKIFHARIDDKTLLRVSI